MQSQNKFAKGNENKSIIRKNIINYIEQSAEYYYISKFGYHYYILLLSIYVLEGV